MGTGEAVLLPRPKALGALAALLSRAESSLAEGSPGAGALLEALDRALLSALWREELRRFQAGARSALGDMKDYIFYRRDFLRRLKARGRAIGPDILGILYGTVSPRLILLVTHACQLDCGYCRVRRYPARMSVAVAEAGVRWLLGGLRREVEIQFFGGEPLLAFSVVERATLLAASLAEASGKKARFLLTTNGLFLPDHALRFFRDHGFSLEFSCDGAHATQLSQRRAAGGRDYYGKLARNLENLRAAGVDYQVIAVVSPENVSRMKEDFQYLARLGHRRIQLNYALGRCWDEAAAAELFRGMRDAAELAEKLGVELVNRGVRRREPVVLNSELTVDCDGQVFRETGICLEEDFRAMKSRFLATRLGRAGLRDAYGSTQFDNLALLIAAYGRGGLRRVLINNLQLGMRFLRAAPWEGLPG